jgi:hypothetical protein
MSNRRFSNLSPFAKKVRFLSNTAEEAGRIKKNRKPKKHRPRCSLKIGILNQDIPFEEAIDELKVFGGVLSNKRLIDYKTSGDKLGAIKGLAKRFVGRTYDEFYSAVKSSGMKGISGIHLESHVHDEIYIDVFLQDGVLYGRNKNSSSGRTYRIKKGELYVNELGVIQVMLDENLPMKSSQPKVKAFFANIVTERTFTNYGLNNCPPANGQVGTTLKVVKYGLLVGPFFNFINNFGNVNVDDLPSDYSNNFLIEDDLKCVNSENAVFSKNTYRGKFHYPKFYIYLKPASPIQKRDPYTKKINEVYGSKAIYVYEDQIVF